MSRPFPKARTRENFYSMEQIAEYESTQSGCFYVFRTTSLNTVAAIFHGVQSLIVFSLIAWLNNKPLKENFISKNTTQLTAWNSTTNSSYQYNTSIKEKIDFLNNRPGVFPLLRVINVWHKIDDASGKRQLEVNEFSKLRAMSDEYFIETRNLNSGEIDVRYIIASFFALSCVFQLVGGQNNALAARLRFVEYSFSASIMILAIGVEAGIRDLYTLYMMFVLTWITMILGLMADMFSIISENQEVIQKYIQEPILYIFGQWTWVIPHACAWVTCIAAYAPIIDNYYQSNSASNIKAPGFVNIIIFLQFGLFLSFGNVQLYSLIRRTMILQSSEGDVASTRPLMYSQDIPMSPKQQSLSDLADFVERLYIVLSFTAKTLLAWLVLSPIITDAT